MRTVRWILAFVLTAAALAMLVLPVSAGPEPPPAVPPEPEELYPDADYIFTENDDGSVLITIREKREPTEDNPLDHRWTHRIIPEDDDYDIIRWTKLSGDISVVYDGPSLDSLNLIIVDDASDFNKFVNVEFRMVSGFIGEFSLMDVYKSEVNRLGKDYDRMFNPLKNAVVKLEGGRVETFAPTTEMIYIDNLEVTVDTGMMVDRFLTSGENGRYGHVYVGLHGGSVGIMTNMQSRIGSVTYELDAGSVDFFSIGANTEMSGNMYLERACTSYISGDVDVYIDPSVAVESAIIGGGVVEMPNMLWNGEELRDSVVRNISIEAHDHTFYTDLCFMNEKRNKTFTFNNYKVGSVPPTTNISINCSKHDGSTMKVYGPEGIWSGYNKITANSGTSVFTNTTVVIPADGSVSLEMGSKMVFTYHTVVYGLMDILGEAVNNYLVEIRDEGKITGRVSGEGICADEISSQSQDSVIKVMTEYDSVLINQENVQTIKEISVLLQGGRNEVRITTQYEDVGFVSSSFLVSMKDMLVSDSFVSGYDLVIRGIDSNTLTACNLDVTVPAAVPEGKVAKVYYFDAENRAYQEVEIISSDENSITFRTHAEGEYSLMISDVYVPEPPQPEVPEKKDDTAEIVLLVACICITLAVMAYTTFRFRK